MRANRGCWVFGGNFQKSAMVLLWAILDLGCSTPQEPVPSPQGNPRAAGGDVAVGSDPGYADFGAVREILDESGLLLLDWQSVIEGDAVLAAQPKDSWLSMMVVLWERYCRAVSESMTDAEAMEWLRDVRKGVCPRELVERTEWAKGRAVDDLHARLANGKLLVPRRTGEDVMAMNERDAVRRLRNLQAVQEQFQASAAVDSDGDGIGEYGTLSELQDLLPLRIPVQLLSPGDRPGSLFPAGPGKRGRRLLAGFLDYRGSSGVSVAMGYVFEVYLPDRGSPAKWVSEEFDAEGRVRIGGAGAIDADLAEASWSAYAKPIEYGGTGRSVFFVGSRVPVLRTDNTVHRWEGVGPIDPGIAFRGPDATSPAAMGPVGTEGELWVGNQGDRWEIYGLHGE